MTVTRWAIRWSPPVEGEPLRWVSGRKSYRNGAYRTSVNDMRLFTDKEQAVRAAHRQLAALGGTAFVVPVGARPDVERAEGIGLIPRVQG